MGLPRLSEPGDRALLHITKCIPVQSDTLGPVVEFRGDALDDVLALPQKGVDAVLRAMGFVFGDKPGDNSIIDYAGVVGEWILFERTKNANGGHPLWRIRKGKAPDVVPLPPKALPVAAKPAPPPPQSAPASRPAAPPQAEVAPDEPLPPQDAEARRQGIRDAHAREIEYVVNVIVPMLRKKKVSVDFSVNAAANALVMDMSKKRCL